MAAIVLAAGMGKRFKSSVPKVLHKAAGLSLIGHALETVCQAEPDRLLVVVGKGRQKVANEVSARRPDAIFIDQPELLGTGDAVRRCADALKDFHGTVIVAPGDGPLLRAGTLRALVERHRETGAEATLLTARLADPTGYGRIIRGSDGHLEYIVEEADALPDQKEITEVSGGVWCFDASVLFQALGRIDNRNAQGEYYLPDTVLALKAKGSNIETLMAEDPSEIEGANDRLQLAAVDRELRLRLLEELAKAGVTVEDPATTYIHKGVRVGAETVIRPMTFLEGSTEIGERCSIGPGTRIVDSRIDDAAEIAFSVIQGSRIQTGAEVTHSVVREAEIGPDARVGPFASLRPGTRLETGAKAGTFVEIKGSVIGEGSKVPHLSYVGDAEIGKGVNLGAGTITGNYDTENKVKSKTTIGDGAFTGSDTTLIAPVKMGPNSGTGAGAVVTKDVEEDEIVMGIPARPHRRRKR